MVLIVIIWGFHYIVMKQGISEVSPITYNALRFPLGLPFLTYAAYRTHALVRVSWRDALWLVGITLVGPLGYQLLYTPALKLTTSTNTALLIATIPVWTALISIALGIIVIRRRLLVAIGVTFMGVMLVILGKGSGGPSFSHDDMIGSGLALGAALTGSVGNILTKPIVDRLGGMVITIWTYWLTTIALVLLAAPDLMHLENKDAIIAAWPNMLYSGLLAGTLGFFISNYALKELGPTRAASYHNITPIIAAVAGIIILGEPLTWHLLVGGPLALFGVIMVRNNTFLRPPEEVKPNWFKRSSSRRTT